MPSFHSKRVILFLLLTFALSWGFELLIALTIKQKAYLATGMHPLGMFFPACSALILQMFVFRDSPIYFSTFKDSARWIFYSFFLLTVVYSVFTLLALFTHIRPLILQAVGAIFVTLWTFVVFYTFGKSSPASLQTAGLQLGNTSLGVRFIGGVVLFLLVQAALNWIFGLGKFPGILDRVGGVPVGGGLYPFAVFVFFLISVVGTPLSALAVLFGEEYGWRGFLHKELIKLGPRTGVFLVGLIWGVWHFPIILSGIHTYPATATGLLLGMVFFVLVGFVFSYAVMKTKSIWVVCFMHGIMNSIYPFVLNHLNRPHDKVFSFGLGIYGLICLAAIGGLIMRDPIWRSANEALRRTG
ncbi:CPBP family intramembrane metalloprotease [candidate division KSB1 bacterium]|nr:CPBP family intramembrane metalloprotease [candidate division KSB1 bacterium]